MSLKYFIDYRSLLQPIQTNASLNPYNRATFYHGDEKGYTDYPVLN